jgi:hypothetical protein
MSRACPVAVRIVRRSNKYYVIGRRTQVICDSFEEAWKESIPYFAGRKW